MLEPVRGELGQPAGEGHGRPCVSPPNITWLIRASWSRAAASSAGCAYPWIAAHQDDMPSISSRPPGSRSRTPSADSTTSGCWVPGHRPVRMPDPPPVDLEQVLDHPLRVLGLAPGLGPPAPLPRFSRIRMLTLIGLPAKPKSSRSRRSMNRR